MSSTVHQENLFFHFILGNPLFLNTAKPEFFTNQNVRELFDIAKEHTLRYKEPPSKEQMMQLIQIKGLGEKFSDDMITGLYNIKKQLGEDYDNEWVENNASSWIQVRNLDSVLRKVIAYMKMTKVTTENSSEVVEKVRHMLSSETAIDFTFDLGSNFFDPASHLQTRLARTSSGYDFIDLCTKGGYWKGSLIVFQGSPKSGKCVEKNTYITIKNKITNEIKKITIKEFYETQKPEKR